MNIKPSTTYPNNYYLHKTRTQFYFSRLKNDAGTTLRKHQRNSLWRLEIFKLISISTHGVPKKPHEIQSHIDKKFTHTLCTLHYDRSHGETNVGFS